MLVIGTGWPHERKYFEINFGMAAVNKVKETLAAEDQQELFPTGSKLKIWVRLDAVMNFLNAADRILGQGDLKLIEACLRYKADMEFNGFFKLMLAHKYPALMIRKVAYAWRHLYDQGDAAFVDVTEHEAYLRVINNPDQPKNHDFAVMVYGEELFHIVGYKDARGEIVKSIHRGDDHMLIKFTW
jgi:hypothetical protein